MLRRRPLCFLRVEGCIHSWGLPWWLSSKESTCRCRRRTKHGFDPWVGKIPWRRKCQPAPVFLPGKFHGQRSLASPWSHKESDMTDLLSMHIPSIVLLLGSIVINIFSFHNFSLQQKVMQKYFFPFKYWHMFLLISLVKNPKIDICGSRNTQ